jgi:LPS-assembly protein
MHFRRTAVGLSTFTSWDLSSLIILMLKFGRWMIYPLLGTALLAQQPEIAAERLQAKPEVDRLAPVPVPEIHVTDSAGLATEPPKNLTISNYGGGPIEGVKDVGLRYLGPGVKVTGDNGLEVFADRVTLDLKAKSATFEGHVSVYQGNGLQRGERAVYYYERKFLDASGLEASLGPILLEAGKFAVEERNGQRVYVGENAGITTHDVEDPDYWVRSKKTTIYPGDKIVFNDLRLYAGETPVFWLPYLSQDLQGEVGYRFIPGSRSNWGPFVLNTYGIMLGGGPDAPSGAADAPWLLSRWHLDLRARRGVGVGVDLLDKKDVANTEITGLGLYYTHDLAPQTTRNGVPRGIVDPERYQIGLKHRMTPHFSSDADWRIDSNLTLLSDEHYLEDFEFNTYKTNPSPDNTIGIYRHDDASLLSLATRFQVNDFYRADTRSPEIAYDRARAPWAGLPFLHEGSTTLGLVGERAADPTRHAILDPLLELSASDAAAQPLLNQLKGFERQMAEDCIALPLGDPRREAYRTQLLDSSYARFRTYQEFSMPTTIGNFLSVSPQAGLGYMRYGMVDGPVSGSERTHLHVGAETSLKFVKALPGYTEPSWGLDGLMHILQPYSTWSLVSTNDFDPTDPMVDRLTPTTRPRPLNPTRFTAVDELQSWNVLRFGARNRLMTRRDHQSFEWLYLDTYVDAFMKDPEGQRDFSNLYNDMRWQPLPWMSADVETQFPIVSGGSGFNEFSTALRFMPTPDFDFSFGYRILNHHPDLVDSNRVEFRTYNRLNEDWGVGTRQVIELDDGTLEQVEYSVHRDLGNWVGGLGFSRRDNRLQREYGMILSLTLKDFPSVSLPFRIDQ